MAARGGPPAASVEVFNSPRSWRGLAVTLAALAGCVLFGLLITWSWGETPLRVAGVLVAGGLWGAVMLPIWLGHRREVAFGPGTLVVRTWWGALLGRPGVNEWVGPEDAWLWRGRGGFCLILPDGPRLGPQSKPLLEAFGRAGFSVRDDAAYWQSLHPGTWRAAMILAATGFGALCVAVIASLLTTAALIVLVGGLGLVLIAVANILLFARGGRPRPFV
jgi:hypothetical protein